MSVWCDGCVCVSVQQFFCTGVCKAREEVAKFYIFVLGA